MCYFHVYSKIKILLNCDTRQRDYFDLETESKLELFKIGLFKTHIILQNDQFLRAPGVCNICGDNKDYIHRNGWLPGIFV